MTNESTICYTFCVEIRKGSDDLKKILIVVDMQKDFVDGSLGTKEAVAILPAVTKRIRAFDGQIIVTFDTHGENYLETPEGKKLPVAHCIRGTEGWKLHPEVRKALEGKNYVTLEKPTFGAVRLPELVSSLAGEEDFSVELIGLCTDICVVSNALLLKAHFYEKEISVNASCCAGVTPESHEAALTTMKMCQINIL